MECAVWLPFIWLSLRLGQRARFSIESSRRKTVATFVFHLGVASLISMGQLSVFALTSSAFRSLRFGDSFEVHLWSSIFSMFVPGVLLYGLIILAAWWLEARHEQIEFSRAKSCQEVAPSVPEKPSAVDPLCFRSGRGEVTLFRSDIDWIRAAGNYLEVHGRGSTHLVRETLSSVFTRLGVEEFQRIHRSVIVRSEAVAAIYAKERGEVVLYDGTRLPVGKTYRDGLSLCPRSSEGRGISIATPKIQAD